MGGWGAEATPPLAPPPLPYQTHAIQHWIFVLHWQILNHSSQILPREQQEPEQVLTAGVTPLRGDRAVAWMGKRDLTGEAD